MVFGVFEMAFAKRFLIAIFLSLGAVAATTPAPAVAQTITVQDVEDVIDTRISELEDEITAATQVLFDPSSTQQEKDDALAVITQNSIRISQLQTLKSFLPSLDQTRLQALYEYFLSIVSPSAA